MVHGDHYTTGSVPGAGIGWGFMLINNDCYVTVPRGPRLNKKDHRPICLNGKVTVSKSCSDIHTGSRLKRVRLLRAPNFTSRKGSLGQGNVFSCASPKQNDTYLKLACLSVECLHPIHPKMA